MSIDFNEMLNRKFNRDKTPTDEFQLELQGKNRANYNNINYTELPIDKETGGIKEGLGGINIGEFLDYNELVMNEVFKKVVLLKSYSTSSNSFEPHKTDVIFDFVDRNGLPFRCRKFSGMDTSNNVSLDVLLNELQGNPVWLTGMLIKSGNRRFVDVIDVNRCEPLMGRKEDTKMFFQREVENLSDLSVDVRGLLNGLPLSKSLFTQYEEPLSISTIPRVVEKRGGYLKYLKILVESVNQTSLEGDVKDALIAYDLLTHIKKIIKDPFEISNVVQDILKQQPRGEDKERLTEIVEESIFNKYEDQDASIYREILDGFRKGIYTLLMFEDWSKYSMETVFSPLSKRVVSLRRN